ncbi:hypothetical protein D9613_010132 [Agrocybe pediades]|uniref:Uncharacterized protein n=1 Tax=Agrocybe pediades TaxID=84607 RepID=A0A8H4QYD5_9AGAR|nr:hypothetical protein D9613_010132 [Agrocybe pediades]
MTVLLDSAEYEQSSSIVSRKAFEKIGTHAKEECEMKATLSENESGEDNAQIRANWAGKCWWDGIYLVAERSRANEEEAEIGKQARRGSHIWEEEAREDAACVKKVQ